MDVFAEPALAKQRYDLVSVRAIIADQALDIPPAPAPIVILAPNETIFEISDTNNI